MEINTETLIADARRPPWQREYMHWREVNEYLQWKLGIKFHPKTIMSWIYVGRKDKSSPTGRRYLDSHTIFNKCMVKREDVDRFIAATMGGK